MGKLFREDARRPVITKRRVVIAGVILLAVAGIFGASFLVVKEVKQRATVAFSIDGKNYSKKEIEDLIQYNVQRGGKKEDAAKKAFEYLKRKAAAEKANIEISDKDIESARSSLYPQSKDTYDPDGQPWMDMVSYDTALTGKLSEGKVSDASGYAAVFSFERRMRKTSDYTPAGYGDVKLIEEDKKYAESRAKYYRTALENNSLTPQAALDQIKADARLSPLGMAGSNPSARFEGFITGEVSRPEAYLGQEVAEEVAARSGTKGISEIKTGETGKEGEGVADEHRQQESYYYFVYIDKPSVTGLSVKKDFDKAMKRLSAHYRGIQ